MRSLSSAEEIAVRDFIEYGKSKYGFDTTWALSLVLVLLDERDGCLISVTDSSDVLFVEDCLSSADIPFQKEIDSNMVRFFVAKSKSHLRRSSIGEGRPDGKFFGYPKDAIDFYCSSSDPVSEFESFMKDSKYEFSSWGDKTPLIEYIPAPSESSIEEALDRERVYEQALKSCSVDISDAHNWQF